MNSYIISIILSLFFLISWVSMRYYSKKDNQYLQFRSHFVAYFGDWNFLFFNLFWPFSFIFYPNIYLISIIFLLGFILQSIMNIYWAKISKENIEDGPFFYKGTNKFTHAGIIHYIFSIVQATLVGIFLLFHSNSVYSFVGGIFLLGYFISGFISSKRIHGKIQYSDAFYLVTGLLLLILSFLL